VARSSITEGEAGDEVIGRPMQDPFAIAAWKANLIPTDDDALAWWYYALLAYAGSQLIVDEIVEMLAEVAPRASA
jgi:hypothetical protein